MNDFLAPNRFIFCERENAAAPPAWEDFLESGPTGGAVLQPESPRAVVAPTSPHLSHVFWSGNHLSKLLQKGAPIRTREWKKMGHRWVTARLMPSPGDPAGHRAHPTPHRTGPGVSPPFYTGSLRAKACVRTLFPQDPSQHLAPDRCSLNIGHVIDDGVIVRHLFPPAGKGFAHRDPTVA